MGYTVKDLLESNRFPEMHLISGSAGIDREIKKPRFIEVEDMEKFLVGEVLMTSMKAYKDVDEHAFLHHLEEFNKKNISGFIVKDITKQSYRTDYLISYFNLRRNIICRFWKFQRIYISGILLNICCCSYVI